MRTAIAAILIVITCIFPTSPATAIEPVDWMVELRLDGRSIEGTPLAWDARVVHLLGRDGRLWQFPPRKAADFRKTSDRFRCYTVSELRAVLLRELGRDFEVSGTTHYLVAHPAGERDKWAERFENLYRSFVQYFSVRGFRTAPPPFPLIGVVCRDRGDFARYCARQGLPNTSGVLGFYARDSNRIVLYDMSAEDSRSWQQNASVIIHEATHQTAFNTGIHSRYVQPPLWVVEGLATMFEAPGVYDSQHYKHRADRINRDRLEAFRQLVAPRHKPELLSAIVASDEAFRTDTAAAYAEAWALSFYLVETQPRKYTHYLARTADRPAFSRYTAAERVADFVAVFGDDWQMLEARFLRFVEDLP
ncbi:MAG: DUF1570 domain-containing protein [Pirellulales bacterium]|nr:DUF1570 domain-containing protein [Pirellulales bacterium]